ncbi:hypothetical protein [Streptomyces capitiformicae]|uniref:Uncharacterized protein n=1 Tax=Streptomyces capitiformicae TaxID=2014920 RepID=A0A918ZQ86_9ACTN|nr:hypothetical protein [Streptomyces capitiformicae]GHE65075.1 hypothetical protein GCM10017771_88670 [Streptomyces capitiformicae]
MSAPPWALVALPLTVGTLLAVVGRPANRYAPRCRGRHAVAALGLAVAVAVCGSLPGPVGSSPFQEPTQ